MNSSIDKLNKIYINYVPPEFLPGEEYTKVENGTRKYRLFYWMAVDSSDIDKYFSVYFLKKKLFALDSDFSDQIYYDIVVLGISKEANRPRCPICNRYINYSCLSHGYPKTCSKACHSELKRIQYNKQDKMTKKGETLSEEIKKKIGNSLRGKPMTEEWKRKHSEYMKKFHKSEEGKAFFKKVAEKVSKTNIRLMKEHGASYAYNKRFKKGIYHSDVFNKDFPYDSGWELIFIKYIEDNSIKEGITVFDRCMDTVEYKMSNGSIHRYLPDFFIRFDSGIRIVIEIKPDYLVNSDEKVIAKSIAGKEYFNKKNIKYVILTEKMFLKNGRIISPDFRLSELIKDL